MTRDVAPQVNVSFDDPNHLLTREEKVLVAKDMKAAVDLDLAAFQTHPGATIHLMAHADPPIPEAASAPASWAPTTAPSVLQSAAELVINTGHQPTAPHPWADGDILINPAFLGEMFLNPNPTYDANATVPPDKVDAVSLFAHEFIHVLGVEGSLDQQATRAPPLLVRSKFDALVNFGESGPTFVGPAAEAQNGGEPVELTAGNLYHVGDATHYPDDLMNGDHIYVGTHYAPSALDDGILADLGYHPKPEDHLLAGFG